MHVQRSCPPLLKQSSPLFCRCRKNSCSCAEPHSFSVFLFFSFFLQKNKESISQAGDNKSVKALNNFRERCMFDGSSVPRGLRERRGEAGPRGGHLVSLNKSNGCRCDRPTSRSSSQRDCGASAPVSPRAAAGGGGHGHVCPTAGWRNASLVFWLRAGGAAKQRASIAEVFKRNFHLSGCRMRRDCGSCWFHPGV